MNTYNCNYSKKQVISNIFTTKSIGKDFNYFPDKLNDRMMPKSFDFYFFRFSEKAFNFVCCFSEYI